MDCGSRIPPYPQMLQNRSASGLAAFVILKQKLLLCQDTSNDIGVMLNEYAIKMADEEGPVKEFLTSNPLPPNMEKLLPDDFRVFSLLINALKQWVVSESASTDRFLLGGNARQICRKAVNKCIVTGGELGDKPELHHPLRDGRPPILISKEGHDLIESQTSQKT